ncbi:MAG: diaminopimelate decarboxylase [Chloroflexi bacterium]|nr:diaminopimelate decarboxylase [Chloroflexota bacterium]
MRRTDPRCRGGVRSVRDRQRFGGGRGSLCLSLVHRHASRQRAVSVEAALWPLATHVDARGHLRVGDVDLPSLSGRYGTPLYLYDAATIREAYREYRAAIRGCGAVRISYAVKACGLIGVTRVLAVAGADASAASLGEVLAARRAGFPPAHIQLHGNAKTDEELAGALRAQVGRIVIDGADEIQTLAALVRRAKGGRQAVWLRLSPGIDVDTHASLRTATLDSKFGAPIATGDAIAQVRQIVASRELRLTGVHAHLGTQLHEVQRYGELARHLARFAHEVRDTTGVTLREIGVGGGLGVPLRQGDQTLAIGSYVGAVIGPLREDPLTARATVFLEPGRSLVSRAGVALYRVTGTKRVPGVITYVAVDGGMGDNIRPSLYGARYTAVLAERAADPAEETIAVAGKYCESGDVLIREVALPRAGRGDLLAIPGAGAYAVAMASNYNHFPRPAVVLLERGRARLIRRRESHSDLWRLEPR